MVASLIDKVPNLAGLARTCEVFDAKYVPTAGGAGQELLRAEGIRRPRD